MLRCDVKGLGRWFTSHYGTTVREERPIRSLGHICSEKDKVRERSSTPDSYRTPANPRTKQVARAGCTYISTPYQACHRQLLSTFQTHIPQMFKLCYFTANVDCQSWRHQLSYRSVPDTLHSEFPTCTNSPLPPQHTAWKNYDHHAMLPTILF